MIWMLDNPVVFGVALFAGLLLCIEFGRWLGQRRTTRHPDSNRAGTGAIEGAIFALLGLLVAFTFTGAAARFDQRRVMIVDEANAIGTAYLRLDLLPPEAQPALRDAFHRYVESRREVYRGEPTRAAFNARLAQSALIQKEIWRKSVAAAALPAAPPAANILLMPALNAMIDITTTRAMATMIRPPPVIYAMLIGLALASAILAGFGMAGNRSRNWLHRFGFALVMSVSIYVIIDLDFPRLGLIRVDSFDFILSDSIK